MEVTMKKITAALVAFMLLVNMMAVMASANATAQVTDITPDIKWTTAYDMYANKLAIVRADAVFIPCDEYDSTKIAKAPGSGVRSIIIEDWAAKGMENYFDDYFNLGDGYFAYDAVWANSGSDPYDYGRLSYTFEVAEAGVYELVIVGCAQIKEADVDNDAKDRGFAVQVDGGDIQQVNISDTLGIFRDYTYEYDKEKLDAGLQYTTNGVNSKYFQPTYYYGIQLNLTAGTHTLDYYHLFSSGELQFESGNGSRLNYMGAYVQKFLTDVERDNYVYPETTTPETTVAPEPETTTPETTAAPETDPETTAKEDTKTPDQSGSSNTPAQTTAEAPSTEKKGCGAMAGAGVLLVLLPAAIVIKKKRD